MTKKIDKKQQDQKAKNNITPGYLGLESTIGAVLLLNTKSPTHRYLFSHEYEWMIIPAIIAKQFILFRNNKNEPVAFVSFAYVNEEVEKRLLNGVLKLTPAEWKSGDKMYIIDVISPFTPVAEILKQLNSEKFKDKEVRILKPNKGKKGMESKLLSQVVSDLKDKSTNKNLAQSSSPKEK